MSVTRVPFEGFSYGGVHSSELGIVRTSNGSRFDENLLPTQKIQTVNIPGRDETYYFGVDNTQRQFEISFAFDQMAENQLRVLKRLINDKQVQDLNFDESPDIVWRTRITASSIKYIPFDEKRSIESLKLEFPLDSDAQIQKKYNSGEYQGIVYKGEGSLQFTSYSPYGFKKYEYDDRTEKKQFGKNEGDYPADWALYLPFSNRQINVSGTINGKNFAHVYTKPEGDTSTGVCINTKTGLIEGYNNLYKKNGKIYGSKFNGISGANEYKINSGGELYCQFQDNLKFPVAPLLGWKIVYEATFI